MSPPLFEWPRAWARMTIGTGRGLSPAQPPSPAGLGRRSPHECWVRLVLGLGGPGVAPAADRKPGRRGRALTTAAVTPEKRRQVERCSPWPWKIFSLDFENLMRVRPAWALGR